MKFTVLSLFPAIIKPFFENSIMKKAINKGIVSFELVDVRDFSKISIKDVMICLMGAVLGWY